MAVISRNDFTDSIYQYMDYTQLSRIRGKLEKLKKLDPRHTIFGSDKHQYRFNPPKTEQELQDFEQKYQITLPEEYRAFLSQVANGGVGPYYGLFSLEDGIKEAEQYSTEENESLQDAFTKPFPFDNATTQTFLDYHNMCLEEGDDDEIEYFDVPDPFTGVIFLADYGCGWNYVLVVQGEQAGKVWMVGDYLSPCIFENMQLGFFDWYEDWLDRSLQELNPTDQAATNNTDKKIINYDGWRLKEVPPEVFESKNLKKLVLSRNDLSVFPPRILELKNLKTLDLSMTPIVDIPPEIAELKELKKLRLNYNYHLALPDTLAQLQNLEEISMFYNYKLEEVPPVVARIENLRRLSFSYCSLLKKLPDNIGNLKKLQSLKLNDCNLFEALPESIGELQELQSLYLGQTKINKLPESFSNLINLEYLGLEIENFDLEDALEKIKKLPKLKYLRLANQLSFPESLRELQNLKTLAITQNYALWHQGHKHLPIPEQITLIPHLEVLDLMNNNQAKSLPVNIGNLFELKEIELGATAIKRFPESMQSLYALEKIQGNLETDPKNTFGIPLKEKEKIAKWFPKAKIWIW